MYKQKMEPIPGLMFSSVEIHALLGPTDGFIRVYKKEWLDSFCKHLEKYDVTKLENTMQVLMKQLAVTLFRQRGIQFEFGSEFKEYSEKKAAGTLGESHLKPLSEVFTEEQLSSIPVDNKAGENYFGHMSQQLKSKGGSAFNAISDRLVLKSSADLAFGRHAANMLKDKELKSKQREITQIETDWPKT